MTKEMGKENGCPGEQGLEKLTDNVQDLLPLGLANGQDELIREREP